MVLPSHLTLPEPSPHLTKTQGSELSCLAKENQEVGFQLPSVWHVPELAFPELLSLLNQFGNLQVGAVGNGAAVCCVCRVPGLGASLVLAATLLASEL